MSNFRKEIEKKLIKSRYNNFGVENYDEYRFGKFPEVIESEPSLFKRTKQVFKKIIGYKNRRYLLPYQEFLASYEAGLQKIYEQINNEAQNLLVNLIAYRLLGFRKVKLPRNNSEYQTGIKMANSLADTKDIYNPHFLHFLLQKCDLNKIGYNIKLYFSGVGVAIDFIFEQYAYKTGDGYVVAVEKDDVVLDLGACWGDTALYFASKTGENGKVFSFEFIPDNIKLFKLNISLNPDLEKKIVLIQFPVSDRTGDRIYFNDNGPGSRVEYEPFEGHTGKTNTISIDDFVNENKLAKVDFIKMDIEGAELTALKGALETIKRFKPKLAIAIYHSMDDFVMIPGWILDLDLGYKIYLDHYTIHSEETIIYAKV